LYSRLRFLTSACLVAFGTVVVAGAIGVLPGLIERLSVGAVEVPPSCKGEIRLPWGRTCSPQSETLAAARNPGSDIEVADHPDLDAMAIVEPPQPIRNGAPTLTEFIGPREPIAPVQQLASAPPAIEEAPQAAPTAQAPPVQSSIKPKPRSVKRVVRREPTSERRREEALSTVRRFGGNNTREIPVDAYAADGAPRRIMIRPTTIQDVYYYYGRR
jgi:hypothetical protein